MCGVCEAEYPLWEVSVCVCVCEAEYSLWEVSVCVCVCVRLCELCPLLCRSVTSFKREYSPAGE